jgi:hypothetical protein
MPEIKGGKKITEAEKKILNAMLALNTRFINEIKEAEKQKNFARAEEIAELRGYIQKIVKGIGELEIQL